MAARLDRAASEAEMTDAAQALADYSSGALLRWVIAHQPDHHPLIVAAADVLNARLAADSPEDAVAWVTKLAPTEWRAKYALQAANTINFGRPDLTVQLLPLIPDAQLRTATAAALWSGLAQKAPEVGIRLALKSTDAVVRNEAVITLATNLADQDPNGATQLVNDAALDLEHTQLCIALIGRSIALKNPAAAAAWVDSLEPDFQSAYVVNTVLGLYREQDAQAAKAWGGKHGASL